MSRRTFQLLSQKVTRMARMGMARDKYWTSHDKLCQTWLDEFALMFTPMIWRRKQMSSSPWPTVCEDGVEAGGEVGDGPPLLGGRLRGPCHSQCLHRCKVHQEYVFINTQIFIVHCTVRFFLGIILASQSTCFPRVQQYLSSNRNCPHPPPSLPLASVYHPPPPPTKGGGEHTRLRMRGRGSPNSDDWRKA